MPGEQALFNSLAGVVPAPPREFVCSWTDGGLDAVWIHLAGELDFATAPRLRQTLREPQLQARLVVLDLRELDFMDCAGLHAIESANSDIRRRGGRLVVLRGPPNVSRLFALAPGADDLEIGDIGRGEAPAIALLRLAEQELL